MKVFSLGHLSSISDEDDVFSLGVIVCQYGNHEVEFVALPIFVDS